MNLKNKILPLAASTLLLFTACEDFLDRKPLSDNVDQGFFTAESQLEPYCNLKYAELLPDHDGELGIFSKDQDSDDQAGRNPQDNFLPQRVTVPATGSYGDHSKLRDCNRFLFYTEENLKNGTLTNSDKVEQYTGEMYFFRAYIYFKYLKKFGDFPIVTTELNDADHAANIAANMRQPRTKVARFILEDLDKAISKLKPRSNALTNHRINRESALLFKSRVALYEGTWNTYHKGTARVPGGSGWPGGNFDGNLDTEIAFFLDQSMAAAKEIAEATALETDYASMFNQYDLSKKKEVLLWRMYSSTANVKNLVEGEFHRISTKGFVGQWGGYTRSLIQSFLMENGLPIYAIGVNHSDANLTKTMAGRDSRLVTSVSKTEDLIYKGATMKYPNLVNGHDGLANFSTTGYIIRKGWSDNAIAPSDNSPLALVVFRAAEAYLNYIEADYVKNKSLDASSRKYWQALRTRAKVDIDFEKTINNTNLAKEIDLAKYSGSNLVDNTLYNIRRERRSEFIAEYMRKDDLYRWRALDQMKNYQVEGMNYFDEYSTIYEPQKFSNKDVNISKYVLPYIMTELAKNGYNFEQANYLSPLSYEIFRLSTPVKDGAIATSVVYQNPGWPIELGGKALK